MIKKYKEELTFKKALCDLIILSNLSLFIKLLAQINIYIFFFQAEDGIRDRSPSRGLGDVYKRQMISCGGYQSRSKLDFSHLQDFHFREKFDSIIRNLEPLSVQYA